jgi:hypothetical protein
MPLNCGWFRVLKIEKEAVITLNELRKYAVHEAFDSSARRLFICQRDYSIKLCFIAEEVSYLLRVT